MNENAVAVAEPKTLDLISESKIMEYLDAFGIAGKLNGNEKKQFIKTLDLISESKIMEYLDAFGIAGKLSGNEKKQFINIAREFNLNPFKREIHITAYGSGDNRKCSIITGYEVYLKRAERTGKLDGWKAWTEGEGRELKALVEIYRKDQRYPFVHEVYYSECCQYNRDGHPNAIWAKQPKFMTKKVAIGQAFRLCFPDDLGGMPYEEAELPQQEERNITPPADQSEIDNIMAKAAASDFGGLTAMETKNGDPEAESRRTYLEAIGAILKTQNADCLSFFSEKEIEMERTVSRGAKTLALLKAQHDRLKKELEKRQAEYKPVPFEDESSNDMPAMYTEEEPEEQAEQEIF